VHLQTQRSALHLNLGETQYNGGPSFSPSVIALQFVELQCNKLQFVESQFVELHYFKGCIASKSW